MEELKSLVVRDQAGDLDAFGDIVRRLQDMAYGCAYSILGDFHLSEGATQAAFIEAYRDLPRLREPAAFPGWFRKIVFKHCDRLTRRKRVSTAPMVAAAEIASDDPGPAEAAENREMKGKSIEAIQALPENERMATTLFYINGYSQKDIAEFLDMPVTTVNNRLHTSRKRLKERMIEMVDQTLKAHAPGDEFPEHVLRLLRAPKPLEVENHPVRKIWDEVRAVFQEWEIVEGPEVEATSTWRRYLRISPGKEAHYAQIEFGDQVLRPTTTITIISAMGGRTPPFKILCVGRVFRDEGPGAKHYPIFHQTDCAHVAAELDEKKEDEKKEIEELRETFERLAGSGPVIATEHGYPFVRSRGWELYVEEGERRQN